MIRLSWLQFRAQAVTAAAALAAAAVTLAATSPHRAQNTGTSHFLFIAGIVVLYLTPALIGTFWGAPLISRELETGTYRLAWTQSVSRTRWLTVKLGLAALASMATAGLLSLMVTWWSSPIDQLNVFRNYRLSPLPFGARDLTPAGYAAFALALGVTIGLLLRRAVPAIAVTLAIFAAVQVAVPLVVRPYLIPPVRTASPLSISNITAVDDWLPGHQLGREHEGGHTRRLDLLQPGHHPGRQHLPRPRAPAMHQCRERRHPRQRLQRRTGQAPPPASGDLPARQPLLGTPMRRNRAIPPARSPARRILHLARQPPTHPLTPLSRHAN